jgi:hypothetical protein
MTDWKDKYEDLKDKYDDLAAVLLQANLALSEAGVGEHASFTERLACLLEDCQRALGASTADHQRMMDAHRAVTRNFPTGAEPDANTTLSLAERIDALARTSQRVGYDAGWLAAREQDLQGQAREVAAQEALRKGYAAVAMAMPGRREILPDGALADHIQTLADACYQQGWTARGVGQAEHVIQHVDELARAHCLLDARGVAAGPIVERIRSLARALNTAECACACYQREDGAQGRQEAYDRGRADAIAVCVATLRRRGTMAPTEGGGIMLDDADYLERVVRP